MVFTLDNESIRLLYLFFETNSALSIEQVLDELSISRRKFYYLIGEVNEFLKHYDLPLIVNLYDKGYAFEEMERIDDVKDKINDTDSYQIIYSQDQRISCIICMIMFPNDKINIVSLMDILDVSRSTVFNDLKMVKSILDSYGVDLTVDIKKGYYSNSDVAKKLSVFQYHLSQLLEELPYETLSFLELKKVAEYLDEFNIINEKLHYIFSRNELIIFSILITLMQKHNFFFKLTRDDLINFDAWVEYRLVAKYFPALTDDQKKYLSIQLAGNRTPLDFSSQTDKNIQLLEVANKLVNDFEKISLIKFRNKSELVVSIFNHFQLSSYLQEYSIQLINPLTHQIQRKYPDIYLLTKHAMEDIRHSIEYPVFQSEIASLTIHFGGHILKTETYTSDRRKVLVVCPTGSSTSKLLKNEIINLNPNLEVVGEFSIKDVIDYEEPYDFIISTVDFVHDRKVVKVNPILSETDKQKIMKLADAKHEKTDLYILDMLEPILERHVDEETIDKIKRDFKLLYSLEHNYNNSKNYPLTLKELLTLDNIIVNDHEMRWKDAIIIASEPLLKANIINETYIDNMINLVNVYGPYIILRDGIALAHSDPIEGITELGVSLLVSENGICFDDKIVNLLFVLSTPNNKAHLGVIKGIANLIANDSLEIISREKNKLEIQKLIFEKL